MEEVNTGEWGEEGSERRWKKRWTMDNLNEAEENARPRVVRESLSNNYCPPIKFVSFARTFVWGREGLVGSVGSMQEETRARIAIFPFS